ncbi:hypothetical protein N9Y92_02780, partial [Chlamydiales bacterium]|nr:hypothetical protein [Chlamydiales bacterium]
ILFMARLNGMPKDVLDLIILDLNEGQLTNSDMIQFILRCKTESTFASAPYITDVFLQGAISRCLEEIMTEESNISVETLYSNLQVLMKQQAVYQIAVSTICLINHSIGPSISSDPLHVRKMIRKGERFFEKNDEYPVCFINLINDELKIS